MPLARAVRTKSRCMKSSIDERVSRMLRAIGKAASVMPGMMKCCQLPLPEIGSHFRCTPKNRISRMPSQKLGIDWPASASTVTAYVDRRVRPRGGEHAERDGDHEREHEGESRKLDASPAASR